MYNPTARAHTEVHCGPRSALAAPVANGCFGRQPDVASLLSDSRWPHLRCSSCPPTAKCNPGDNAAASQSHNLLARDWPRIAAPSPLSNLCRCRSTAVYVGAAPHSCSRIMSLFFDQRLDTPPGASAIACAWCKVDAVVAVATSNRTVALFQEEVRLRAGCGHARARASVAPGHAHTSLRRACCSIRMQSCLTTATPPSSRGTPASRCWPLGGTMVRSATCPLCACGRVACARTR